MEEADDEGSTPGLTGDSWPVCSTEVEVVCVNQVDIGEGERGAYLVKLFPEGVRWLSDQKVSRLVDGMARGVGVGRAIVESHTRAAV